MFSGFVKRLSTPFKNSKSKVSKHHDTLIVTNESSSQTVSKHKYHRSKPSKSRSKHNHDLISFTSKGSQTSYSKQLSRRSKDHYGSKSSKHNQRSKHHHHHASKSKHYHSKICERNYEYTPEKNLILAKVSYVNEAMVDFKAEIYDDQDDKECHFVRILRVGPEVKDPVSTAPGNLIIVHKAAGMYLEVLSKHFAEEYYLLSDDDILAFVDM